MSDVSRETVELQARYADVPALGAYAEILATRGVERGLIGPREVPRLWPRHVVNCAVVAQEARQEVPVGARVADIGSGAGLPGIVWALVRPDLRITLVEPLLRRATFLREVVADLGISERVDVLRARAEDLDRGGFDVVTARAVARLDRLAAWTLPLTGVGGWVVALKGSSVADEVDEAMRRIRSLGGGTPVIRHYGSQVLEQPTTVVLIPRVTHGSSHQPDGRRR